MYEGTQRLFEPKNCLVEGELLASNLSKAVSRIINTALEELGTDNSGYFDEDFFRDHDRNIAKIVHCLQKKGYFVFNGYNDNYIIAFALDHARFDVWTSIVKPRQIQWHQL